MTAEATDVRAGSSGRRSALAYGLASLVLSTAGFAVAAGPGQADGVAVGLGVYGAWTIQIAAFWRLADALGAGRPVLRPWIAGIAARGAGLILAFAMSTAGSLDGDALLLAYGGAMLGLLLLEAGWLAVGSPALTVSGGSEPLKRQRKDTDRGRRG